MLVMRRLQVQGRPGFPQQYRGAVDCVSQMLRKEGVASFWRGSLSSYLKVVPSIAATRWVRYILFIVYSMVEITMEG